MSDPAEEVQIQYQEAMDFRGRGSLMDYFTSSATAWHIILFLQRKYIHYNIKKDTMVLVLMDLPGQFKPNQKEQKIFQRQFPSNSVKRSS